MEAEGEMEQLVKELFPNFWIKLKITPGKLQPVLKAELYTFVTKAICVQSMLWFPAWRCFLQKYTARITSSPKIYLTYVFFICKFEKQHTPDPYECFISIGSLVTTIAAYFYGLGYSEYLQHTSKILTIFFNQELKDKFNERGGWGKICQFIVSKGYLEWHDDSNILTVRNYSEEKKLAAFVAMTTLGLKIGDPSYSRAEVDTLKRKDVESDPDVKSLVEYVDL